jgi:uncharacterized protein YecE (DUF72 family)
MREGLYIGTSGWSYAGWKDEFFAGFPRRDWLRHYAERFNAVEVNATFYGGLQPATFERWKQETPAGFKFAIKGHRYLTHVSKLLFPPDALARQRDTAMILADKLAVVIWQMPSSLTLPCSNASRRLYRTGLKSAMPWNSATPPGSVPKRPIACGSMVSPSASPIPPTGRYGMA